MDSLRLIPVLVLLCIFVFDSTYGKLQIFTAETRLVLRSSKCKTCVSLSYSYHKMIDPMNLRVKKSAIELAAILEECSKNTLRTKDIDRVVGPFMRRSSKWCGNNGDASVKNCCKERSKCPQSLKRNKSKGKAKNINAFTIYGCDCELEFTKCLLRVGNKESKKVHNFYSYHFPGACLTYDHPIRCSHKRTEGKATREDKWATCTTNKQKPKKWQIRNMLTGDSDS